MDLIELIMYGLLEACYGNIVLLTIIVFICVIVALKSCNIPLPGAIFVGGGLIFTLNLYFTPVFGFLWTLTIIVIMILFALLWLKLGRKVQ